MVRRFVYYVLINNSIISFFLITSVACYHMNVLNITCDIIKHIYIYIYLLLVCFMVLLSNVSQNTVSVSLFWATLYIYNLSNRVVGR